jgi:ADP-ribose pyrophosphatase YjhB (NUDIX family)
MERKTHCHFCGQPLHQKFIEGRDRLYCIACERPIYENPVPATCIVVVNSDRHILLVRRSVEPKIGEWCLPGGFLEIGETPENGALRELAEETGLSGEIESLLGVRTTPSQQYHSILMIAFSISQFQGQPAAGDDADDVDWFSRDQLPQIAFDSHRYFLDRYFHNRTHRKN